MDRLKAKQLNVTTLAYVGDAAYELIIRQMLVEHRAKDAGKLHHEAIAYVSSTGQSTIAKKLCEREVLTEEEEHLLKRARNHRATSRPQNADPKKYKWATGFEALIGFLYLAEDDERLQAIMEEALKIIQESRNE
ncbi:MAG: Mini-ribonuclease 3 [Clostridiales bacterium]|nr:Mini-ribonuclease 3 [Candidatus Crickella merdequi]